MEEYKPGDRVVVTSVNSNGGKLYGDVGDHIRIIRKWISSGNYLVEFEDKKKDKAAGGSFYIRPEHFSPIFKDYDTEQQPYDEGDI